MLTQLGEDAADSSVREIFAFPTTVFSHDENLSKVVDEIDTLDWHSTKKDGLGQVYESLLERNAAEARSGAGQYFTPRPLVDCIVRLMKPRPGEVIQDPAAGTGGFLISADHQIRATNSPREYQERPPAYRGVEIESDTYRLCLMNLFLHNMEGQIKHGDALTEDVRHLEPADLIIANPPFGISAGGARVRRNDLPFVSSNKQLAFLQHIYLGLKAGGRAAVVVPDNVLFEEGVGRKVRADLMEKCDLHTILRLPTGIFYAAGVNTNVLMFARAPHDGTKRTWIYDLRTNIPRFKKTRPIQAADFLPFETAYGNDPNGKSKRRDEGLDGRFRCFTRDEIARRNDNLDISWLRNAENVDEDKAEPEEIAAVIATHLKAALAELESLTADIQSNP
ncbi:N-6 DNA methylase [Bradyrhizobium sp. PRIMUS42]|uniref:HsdM family class I SAM-dependent methyltransferase n=1 Tax=Bradyrhizobium sp. PRIMUS42 TaxID=2908926 RepID=UPI0028681659|nr:N-6 DNA methylase [Bradyrhizobium sp. PRIMUS42]